MKLWPTKPLGELCDVEGGNAAPQGEGNFVQGTTPFVRMKDLGRYHLTNNLAQTDDKLTEASVANNRMRIFSPGCILFPRSGSVALNHRAILGVRACIVSHIGILQNLRPEIKARYLYLYLTTFDMTSLAKKTTGVDSIAFADVKRIPIPVPPIPEQERIVNLLDEADELRKLRTKADRRTAELIPALFHEMFGDGESKDFVKVKLGEITEIKSGAGFPLDQQGRLDQPIPFFKVGDMNTQGNEWAMFISKHTISEATRRELCAALLPANSIIFPKVGAAIGTNKKRVIIRPSCVDNNVMAIIPGRRITPEFLLAMVKAKNLMDFASNSNPPSIRKTTVESWEIALPPVSLQKEFAIRVNEIRRLEADQASSRLRLETLFQSLLHLAFNGGL